MSRSFANLARVTGFLGASALLYVGVQLATPRKPLAAAVDRPVASTAMRGLTDLSDAFSSVAEGIKPSVVYISSKRPGSAEMVATEIPPEFRQFFGVPESPRRRTRQRTPLVTATGSGFVVSADGFILTNNHVVDGATQVRVRLLDRHEYDAKVVGTDPATDVAVLKIDAHDLTPAPLGISDVARVGEWVLAVGNPFGENLTFTVTQGIISAKGRALDLPNRTARSIQDFIQTDAAINPGNSGGPLVNMRGEVIGINSAIASETGTYSGYGFAIPIDLARKVMDQIVKSGKVERVALGILARDGTAEDAGYAQLDRIGGVLVEDFPPESPAKAAGIEAGDLIIAIDQRPVNYVAELQEAVGFKHPGDRVAVQVARKGGKRVVIDVRLAKAPAESAEPTARSEEPSGDGAGIPGLGASFAPLDDRTAAELQLPERVHGLMVTGVDEDGPAAARLAGPDQGPDILESVEGHRVATTGDLRKVMAGFKPGEIITLEVWNARAGAGRIERIKVATR